MQVKPKTVQECVESLKELKLALFVMHDKEKRFKTLTDDQAGKIAAQVTLLDIIIKDWSDDKEVL